MKVIQNISDVALISMISSVKEEKNVGNSIVTPNGRKYALDRYIFKLLSRLREYFLSWITRALEAPLLLLAPRQFSLDHAVVFLRIFPVASNVARSTIFSLERYFSCSEYFVRCLIDMSNQLSFFFSVTFAAI